MPNPFTRRRGVVLILAGVLGMLFGLSLFTFTYAEGTSYFSNDPETCLNCHVMRDQYESWNHSSHKEVAVCNDCHTPHNLAGKLYVEARNGWNHSTAFTFGTYKDNIRIKDFNKDVVLNNCVECHETFVSDIVAHADPEEIDCVTCHGNVGHRRN